MNKRNAMRQTQMAYALSALGISNSDIWALRRISMTLHRWHELECGTDRGAIERDEATQKTYWLTWSHATGKQYRSPTPDRETGALKRLGAIMARHPTLKAYVQGDPRGCALYVLRPGETEDNYSRGIAIY